MNYHITSAKTTHHFMPKPETPFLGNQSEETLKINGDKLAGYYTTCGNGDGYLDWEYKDWGIFAKAEGPCYGFLKSRPHWAFTSTVYGIKLFNRLWWFGKSYNFARTKNGVRGYGLMIISMKLKKVKDVTIIPVKKALNLKEDIVLDPHLQ